MVTKIEMKFRSYIKFDATACILISSNSTKFGGTLTPNYEININGIRQIMHY